MDNWAVWPSSNKEKTLKGVSNQTKAEQVYDVMVTPLPLDSTYEPLVENVVLLASALTCSCINIVLVVQFELWRTCPFLNLLVCIGSITSILNHGIRYSGWRWVDRIAMVVIGAAEAYPLLYMPGSPLGTPAGISLFLYCTALLAMGGSLYFVSRMVLSNVTRFTSMINTLCHATAHILVTYTHAIIITQYYLYEYVEI